MPAASDSGSTAQPDARNTWRPLGVAIASGFFFAMLVIVCLVAWVGFGDEVRGQFTFAQRATLIGIGVGIGVILFGLCRSKVTVTDEGVVVVNGYRTYRHAWAEVESVHLKSGSPWASLRLVNGDRTQVMALQGSDGDRARAGVRAIRARLQSK
ncbi:PH domain-containing protein [Nocardioides yefusunii]|uniref:PH domain-containing protein n=1 Tax=Nocardioides yefusunii TaxID=2500546 RepID=A0ABW1QXT6_9ACTN|nr:PH domain-containing protein [Nocardioides yefusunii]